ncbi:hypothetical protein OS493_040422, partial [Desmophyllum pertusum]
ESCGQKGQEWLIAVYSHSSNKGRRYNSLYREEKTVSDILSADLINPTMIGGRQEIGIKLVAWLDDCPARSWSWEAAAEM